MTNQDEAERRRQDLIQQRAYEIYRGRGGLDGLDLQDWLQAEREVDGLPLDEDQVPPPEEEEQSAESA
jgi:hypothetical protein